MKNSMAKMIILKYMLLFITISTIMTAANIQNTPAAFASCWILISSISAPIITLSYPINKILHFWNLNETSILLSSACIWSISPNKSPKVSCCMPFTAK